MISMLKLMGIMALCFASTFIILNATGIITIEGINNLLEASRNSSLILIGCIFALLLFADLFVAMPTLTLVILSGFFLGPQMGALFSITGLSAAGFTGYWLSHRFGNKFVKILIKDEAQLNDAISSFTKFGTGTILLSRAMPILPEVSACMAGLTNMPKYKFATIWLLSTVPYAVIASYAGSISSQSNPKPAIITALVLTAFFWLAWLAYRSLVIKKNV